MLLVLVSKLSFKSLSSGVEDSTSLAVFVSTVFVTVSVVTPSVFISSTSVFIEVKSFLIVLVGMSTLILTIPQTNFYKNIKVHLDYLKVKDVMDIIDNGNLIDHFIFSQRVTFFTDRKYLYDNSPLTNKLFGIGYYEQENKQAKLIEMDYLDIYFNHGILGFIIFFSIFPFLPIPAASSRISGFPQESPSSAAVTVTV